MTSFTICKATLKDASMLAKISGDSFKADSNTQLKYGHDYPRAFTSGMKEGIVMWIKNPRCDLLKAVDNNSGEIMGWACWARRGYVVEEKPAQQDSDDDEDIVEEQTEESPISTVLSPEAAESIGRLESLTSDDMEKWQAVLMPEGAKARYVIAINISPSYQSRGVGSALLKWGTSKADEDGVFCWVHASEAGQNAFEKAGFKEIGKLQVNLDEYAGGRKNGDGGDWGSYTFRYMKRDAKEK